MHGLHQGDRWVHLAESHEGHLVENKSVAISEAASVRKLEHIRIRVKNIWLLFIAAVL